LNRPGQRVASAPVVIPEVKPLLHADVSTASAQPVAKMGENLLTIGAARKNEGGTSSVVEAPVAIPAHADSAPISEAAKAPPDVLAQTAPEAPVKEQLYAVPAATGVMDKNESNELVPEINGPSYTAKKLASGALDPIGKGGRPGAAPLVKKPDAKKPQALVPPVPAKPVVKQADAPRTILSKLDSTKVDFSKAPIYVLNDGRRIRALAVRDNGKEITVKNEAGLDVTFKKSDVKEILRG
jgi:hypothetical protein